MIFLTRRTAITAMADGCFCAAIRL